jgi:type IV secretion system protein VirB10
LPALPQEPEPAVTVQASPTLQATPVNPAPAPKTPAKRALDRELSGPAFAGNDPESQASEPPRANAVSTPPDPLEGFLRPTTTPAARAERLPTQHLLLPKGSVVDCTLLTAIDSTLPGMTTCITATDTFSADGTVVLLERGTKLVGETRGEVQQGASRVFVLWTEARTPTGIVVPLASPGTDELGRSGLAGEVNRHFWQRFGAAMLVSLIEGGVQAAVTSRSNGGAVIVNPTAATEVSTEVLKSTIAIPPTLRKDNGDRIQVLVARDLDFRGVYELRAVGR